MDIEVLVSTMHKEDHSIIDDMNLQSNAIIVNQCDKDEIKKFKYNDKSIQFYSFSERGVGLSRNNALMRSTADICLIADDDMVYVDNYQEIVLKAFEDSPSADVIIFSVTIHDNRGQRTRKLKNKRVRFYNFMRYGTVRIGFKRNSILKNNIFFSLLFGGGAKYGSGEDTLFMYDCLRKGLKVYTSPEKIADVYNYNSTWFKGYNKKFFEDKGALFAALSKRWYWALCLQFAIRRQKLFCNDMRWIDAYRLMLKGAKEFI